MMRRTRLWGLALAGSLLLHAGLFGGLDWKLPRWNQPPDAPPLEVQLAAPPLPVVAPPPAPAPPPRRITPPRPRAPIAPLVQPEPTQPMAEPELPTQAVTGMPDASPEPEAAADASVADSAEPEPVTSTEPVPPPLNSLPARLDLRYRLDYGIASGEQTLVWINEGERYTLTSVASATGLAGIFYRGHFVQTSRGRITLTGLQPEEFWDQRGSKRSRASFDAAQGLLLLMPDHGASRQFSYQAGVQDVLSLFFQLALTAPPSGEQLAYTVFNGKKLRDYRYRVLGEVQLDTELGALRTLHLRRAGGGDGSFEIWLAIDRHYLPVRVLGSDSVGNEMELSIQSIAP